MTDTVRLTTAQALVRWLVAQLGLEQGLPDAGDVAVAEDPEAARDEALPDAVPLAVLHGQEPDDGLRDREPGRGGHDRSPEV